MTKSLLPLAIDVDGTLLRSDITQEMFWLGILKFPWFTPKILYLIATDRPALKAFLMPRLRAVFNPKHLPYNQDVLKRAKAHHEAGGEVILCSGSEHGLIETIAAEFEFIDAGYGTSETVNLVMGNKAGFLTDRYPDGFIYIGNSTQDFKVWAAADEGLAIAPPKGTETIKTKTGKPVHILEPRLSEFGALFEAARPALIPFYLLAYMFIAYLAPHQASQSLSQAAVGFAALCFGLCGGIILNDLYGVAKDRAHAAKKYRPLASGRLSATLTAIAGGVLILAAMGLTIALSAPYRNIILMTLGLCLTGLWLRALKNSVFQ